MRTTQMPLRYLNVYIRGPVLVEDAGSKNKAIVAIKRQGISSKHAIHVSWPSPHVALTPDHFNAERQFVTTPKPPLSRQVL